MLVLPTHELVAIVDNPCLLYVAMLGHGEVAAAHLHLEVALVVDVHLHLHVVHDEHVRRELEYGDDVYQIVLAEDRAVLEARIHHGCYDVVVL